MKFFKELFTWAIVIVAIGFVLQLLESVFSKDDGIIKKESLDILSNSSDKEKILDAINDSIDHGGATKTVTLSNNEIVQISA